MRKLVLASLLLLALALPAAAQSPKPPGFRGSVDVDVVNVDVAVTDRQGNRVTGLKKEDFQVFEDGKRVEIVNFDVQETGAGELSGGGSPVATATPEEGWTLAVFVDDFNIQPAHRTRVLQQLREFLARNTAPGDRVLLATNDLGLRVRVPFTSDLSAIDRGIQEISGLAAHGQETGRDRILALRHIGEILEMAQIGATSPVIPCPLNVDEPAQTYAGARRQEALQSLGALKALISSLSGLPGRKAVLHVSDGIPLVPGHEIFQYLAEICKDGVYRNLYQAGARQGFSGESGHIIKPPVPLPPRPEPEVEPEPPENPLQDRMLDKIGYNGGSQAPADAQTYSVAKELEALTTHANSNRVTLYALQASGTELDPETETGGAFRFPSISLVVRSGPRDLLHFLADETGGRAILDANDVGLDLSRMRQDFATAYSLGISPAHGRDGREHRLTVKLKQPDLQLRYRRSYRDRPALERAVDRTLAALYHGVEENPLGVTMEIGDQSPAGKGQYSVPVRLRIPLFKLAILNQDGTFKGNLRLMAVVRDEQWNTSALRQVEVPLSIPRKEVLNAMGQFYVYTLTLQMRPGLQQVAVAVRDDVGVTTSYLSRAVTVGGVAAASSH